MNPLKWAVWIRIAIVATILWEGVVFTNNWVVLNGLIGAGGHFGFNMGDILYWSIPVALFWGIAWIVHGIRHKSRQRNE